MHRRDFQLIATVLALALLQGGTAFGQPNPQAPVYIRADFAEMNENTGISVYRGDVRIEQKAVELNASVITVYTSAGTIQRIVATGKPVTYTERREGGEPVVATGSRFDYSLPAERIVLTGDARVRREGNLLRGDRIVYDVAARTAEVTGDSDRETAPRGRVETILQPSSDLLRERTEKKAD